MRSFVSFQTTFPPDDETLEDRTYIPAGSTIAHFMSSSLQAVGIEISEQPYNQEDYAWGWSCNLGSREFWCLIGFVGENDRQWLVTVQSRLSRIQRWRGVDDAAERLTLCHAIHRILTRDPRFMNVRWYTEEEWNRNADDGTGTEIPS